MRAWYRDRRKARANRRAQKAIVKYQRAADRLHGHHAKPPRRRGGSGDDWVDTGDLGDLIVAGLAWLVRGVFKIFD